MKRLLPYAIFLLAAAVSRADLTIVNEVTSEGQTQEMVMKLKDKNALVDLNPQMSVLLDGATGDSVMLMHEQKKAMKIPATSMKTMLSQLGQQQENDSSETAELKPNGKTETINGFKTEGYTYKKGEMEAEYFLAPDFPELKDTLAQLQAFQESGVNSLAGSASQIDVSTFPGFPVRTIVESGGKTVTSTVKSVKRDELPAETFEMPAGYETMEIPMLPNVQP